MKNNLKKIFNFLLLLTIAVLVLYFSLKDDYNTIVDLILSMNKIWVIVAILLVFSYYFFRAIVIKKLANKFNEKYSFKSSLRMVLETNFFHAVTPFATGGQPYEIYSLTKRNLKITEATNVSIQNFIVYQIAIVLLGILALLYNYFFHIFSGSLLKNLVVIGFLINFIVIVALFVLTFTKKINKVIIKFILKLLHTLRIIKNEEDKEKEINEYLKDFNEGAKLLLNDKFEFIINIFLELISLCGLYLVPLALLYATGDYTSFNSIEAIVTSAYVMLIGSFVPIPGGTGGLEYGFVTFYGTFLTSNLVKAIMLVWRVVTYYLGMLIGAIVLSIKKEG